MPYLDKEGSEAARSEQKICPLRQVRNYRFGEAPSLLGMRNRWNARRRARRDSYATLNPTLVTTIVRAVEALYQMWRCVVQVGTVDEVIKNIKSFHSIGCVHLSARWSSDVVGWATLNYISIIESYRFLRRIPIICFKSTEAVKLIAVRSWKGTSDTYGPDMEDSPETRLEINTLPD